ncbi:MAG: CGCGG family rSAM-modified RiPP protein [Halobacteriaceae archaeon]
MTGTDEVPPVTDRPHDTSWSANLEHEVHAQDQELVIGQAIEAVRKTASGTHVNLVTHGDHGHPETYLFEALAAEFDGTEIDWEFVDRCGCGGYVTRVYV